MKKILCIVLALALTACLFAGCGNKNRQPDGETDLPSESAESDSAPNDAVTVDGEAFDLSYESHHRELYYKTDIEKLGPNTMGTWCELAYYRDEAPLVRIHIVYYEGKTAEDVMAESNAALTEKTVGDTPYQYFEYDENGVPGHTYLYAFNGSAYTVSFVSDADISALETAFMRGVTFKAGD